MEREIFVEYISGNINYYKINQEIDKLIEEIDKTKNMTCKIRIDNIPLFLLETIKELNKELEIYKINKEPLSLLETYIVEKWRYLLIVNSLKQKDENILKNDLKLLYGNFDKASIILDTSIYDLNKLVCILEKYIQSDNLNTYDYKRKKYVLSLYEKLLNSSLINQNLKNTIKLERDNELSSNLDYTYEEIDDKTTFNIPEVISNNEELINRWKEDVFSIQSSYPYSLNYNTYKRFEDNVVKKKTI